MDLSLRFVFKAMKLASILFETAEDYYQSTAQVSGRLNSELAKDAADAYRRSGKVRYVEYDPAGWTRDAAAETSEPNNLGGINRVGSIRASKQKVVADLKDNIVYLQRSALPEHDPLVLFQLEELIKAFPEIQNFEVKRHLFQDGKWTDVTYAKTADQFLSGKLEMIGSYPRYKKGEELYDEFKFEVLKDLRDIDWYHATTVSNYERIMREGLRPSKDFPGEEQQKRGWTTLNFDLQNAVYLTHDIDRAIGIAETLVEKHGEDAVILKVMGAALSDPAKIVVDEDVLRDEYTDEIYPREAQGIPEYIISITSEKIAGLGYKSRISKEFIDVAETIKFEKPEEDNES